MFKILIKDNYPVVFLKAGIYDQEIKKDILENINPNTSFLWKNLKLHFLIEMELLTLADLIMVILVN